MNHSFLALAALLLLTTPVAAQAACSGVAECAEQGDAEGQAALGFSYLAGSTLSDYAEAERWFRLAAEQGKATAQAALGIMHYLGLGVPQDYAEAAKWSRLAAEQGDAGAQAVLGGMYLLGEGVPQDYAEAAKWSRLAAEQGDADAQVVLGTMYYQGVSIPQDLAEAAKWFRLAAEQGDVGAQAVLGSMYLLGEGVPQDYVQAYKRANLGAAQGNSGARDDRDRITRHMTRDQTAEAQQLAREWWADFVAKPQIVREFARSAPAASERGPEHRQAATNSTSRPSMSQSEIDGVVGQIARCWSVPSGARGANLKIEIDVEINSDGTVRDARIVDTARYGSDDVFRAAAESARRAALNPQCSPLRLPPHKFEAWQRMTLVFNPQQVL